MRDIRLTERARFFLNIEEVMTNFLVSKECTILCDWQVILIQEAVKLANRLERRILIQVLNELSKTPDACCAKFVIVILNHLDQTPFERLVKNFVLLTVNENFQFISTVKLELNTFFFYRLQ